MANNIWQLQDAKSRLSELVDRALKEGVQVVTRRGKNAVVVLPFEEYERMTHPAGRLSEFFLASPLAGSGLNLERDQERPREIDLKP